MKAKNLIRPIMGTAAFLLCGSVQAVIEFDQNITPTVFYGSGNPNGNFTTDRNNGIEVGLRAKLSGVGTTPSNGDGTYSFALGAVWNFDFAINVDYLGNNGTFLSGYQYEFGIDTDPGLGVAYNVGDPVVDYGFGFLAPDHSIGNNNTDESNDLTFGAFDRGGYDDALAANNALQQSWGVSVLGYGNAGYDANTQGTYHVYFAVSDGSGNEISRSTIQVLIGGAPPAFPPNAPQPMTLDAASDSGMLDNDQVTNVNVPQVWVECSQVGHVVNIYQGGSSQVGTMVCAQAGPQLVTLSTPLADGDHDLTYTESNAVGESAHSSPLSITVDTVAPNSPAIAVVADNVTQVLGTAEPSAEISITGASCTNAPVLVNVMGEWACDLASSLVTGDVVTANATDLAGNVSLPSVDAVVQHVNLAPSFAVSCNLDATDVTGGSNDSIVYPAYAFGMNVGAGETQNYTLDIEVDPMNDPDGVVQSALINNNGDLVLVIDTATNSVATVDITMQDDGGTALGGVDSATSSFNVHNYADQSMDPNFAHLQPGDLIYKNTLDVCRL